ncbi:MAG: HlyD family efflux transporter periplasmic adaptor subunit, partial [Bryobacteraceae bacterium]
MSAITNLTPAPVEQPKSPAPALHPPSAKKPFPWGVIIFLIVMAGGAWLAYKMFFNPQAQSKSAMSASVRTAKITSGPLERVMRVTGNATARNFGNITAPMMRGPDSGRALILIYLTKSGGVVKKGEVVAQIDGQSMKDHVDDIAAQVQQAESDITKRKAEQAIDWENLQQTLRVAKSDLDKAALEAGASEVRTVVDAELLRLSVDETKAKYKQLQEDLTNKQASYAAEIRILEITKERHARHRDRHQHDIERFTVRAPISGLAVMQTLWRGMEMAQVQQGDQLAPGQPFMKIVDTNSMQVEGQISQVGSDEARLGQPATVRFDAFPDLKIRGRIRSIGAIATSGGRTNFFLRNVPVTLDLIDRDPRIIPDLSTSADVVLERSDNATLVPVEAVSQKDGKQVVFVKKGLDFQPREVKLGLGSNTHYAVLSGLQVGDEIA